jgi:hypothetical protein
MSPLVSCRTSRPPAASPWWRLIDWRTVAAVGLPLWAFVFGLMVPRTPAPAAPEPPAVVVVSPTPAPPDDGIPPPREIVVREAAPAVVTVPVVVAVPAEPEAVAVNAAPEFKLPDAELMPADRCKTFDTKVRFHRGPAEAAAEAKASRKMMFVLHVSGNFEDPGFT